METLTALLIVMFAATPASARPDPHLNARVATTQAAPVTPAARPASQRERSDACRKPVGDGAVAACASTTLHGKFDAEHARLRNCSRQAAERKLKGYERVDFMASCLHV